MQLHGLHHSSYANRNESIRNDFCSGLFIFCCYVPVMTKYYKLMCSTSNNTLLDISMVSGNIERSVCIKVNEVLMLTGSIYPEARVH